MLSYPLDEAETLIETQLSGVKESIESNEQDLVFLREQSTVGFSYSRPR